MSEMIESNLMAEVARLEARNQEYHEMTVKLQTELQDTKSEYKDVVANYGDLNEHLKKKIENLESQSMSPEMVSELNVLRNTVVLIDELVDIAGSSSNITQGALLAIMGSISHVLAAQRKTTQDVIPGIIKEKIDDIEKSLNADLPEGMSVKIMPQAVSSEQMAEMLKIAKGN